MTLAQIVELQQEFDSKHHNNFRWDEAITEQNISMLGFVLLSLVGELGETANLTKKIWRGDFSLENKREELQEEITDIFIYVVKLSYQLGFDLEESFLKKLEKNIERFEKYEND